MEDSAQILPRDKLLRDNFTPAESLLFSVILIMASMISWIGDPRSFWLLGSLLIIGCLTPFLLKTHEHTHPFFVDLLWPKFWICTAPAWTLLLQFLLGLFQNPLSITSIGDLPMHTVAPISLWRPTSAVNSSAWVTMFGFCASYLMVASLYIVPKSRAFFERLFPWLCFGAVLVAIFGYIQKGLGLTSPLLTPGTGHLDFFAFFPYDGHWAAFATLWCCTCIALALLSTRYDDSPDFIQSIGPWYLTGGALLGASGFLVHAQIPAAILLFTLSIMLLIVAANFLANSKDVHRKSIATCSGLIASLSFAGGIYRMFQENTFASDAAALRIAAFDMFKANPIFGWGIDSYQNLLPFYADDRLLGKHTERASSDLLQILAEFGLFGGLIIVGFLFVFIYRYIRGPHNVHLTNHLLIGCGAVLLLSLCDSPFMSPAVFFSFCTIMFSALRWAEISRNKVDEVDAARPQLVTHESKRRLPFFNTHYQEEEK
ncbi:O-antigen ligase family protein [Coraliomargarita sp. SDUM461004]|uniref:O-antigen ligase family protein n=1 Tax=Thalassobacterium sedimentorum TaxID=3041258 RepID=A0ABU1AGP1_9BACT|nr:O-antigen ligase family protein [Coraliomargarita sp. SDUM461004]MDQ8193015.1 O-antigen ligase family protein [Coraliomargarita sp. SDUM461004]